MGLENRRLMLEIRSGDSHLELRLSRLPFVQLGQSCRSRYIGRGFLRASVGFGLQLVKARCPIDPLQPLGIPECKYRTAALPLREMPAEEGEVPLELPFLRLCRRSCRLLLRLKRGRSPRFGRQR